MTRVGCVVGRRRGGAGERASDACGRPTACRRASTTSWSPTCPYVREDEWATLAPEIRLLRAAERPRVGRGGPRRDTALVREAPCGLRLALEHAPGAGRGGARAARRRGDPPRSRRPERVTMGHAACVSEPEDVATFERCIAVGGVALFPADTVYGLATEPESKEGFRRLNAMKGRVPDKPSAVMFFSLELALAALPELGPTHARRAREAAPWPAHPGAPQPGRAGTRSRAGPARPPRRCGCPTCPRSARREAGPCSSRAPTPRAARTRAASRTSIRPSARASTSSSTAASCRARRRRWSTWRGYETDGTFRVLREGARAGRARSQRALSAYGRPGAAA